MGLEEASVSRAKLNSLERIKQAVNIIETHVPKELVRQSQARRRQIVSAYESLSLHCHKLEIALPKLDFYYNPQQYLDHARLASEKTTQMEAEEVSK